MVIITIIVPDNNNKISCKTNSSFSCHHIVLFSRVVTVYRAIQVSLLLANLFFSAVYRTVEDFSTEFNEFCLYTSGRITKTRYSVYL